MTSTATGDYIDIRKIFYLLRRRWPIFAGSIVISISLALLYIRLTHPQFEVRASIHLKDESLSAKGNAREKFINGVELLETESEIEDEIAILSSNSLIEEALSKVNFEISYFENRLFNLPLTKTSGKELYGTKPIIKLDRTHRQAANTKVNLSFPDESSYRIEVDATDIPVYDLINQREVTRTSLEIDTVLDKSQPFIHESLAFSLSDSIISDQLSAFYFIINPLESLREHYSQKLKIDPVAPGSNIVYVSCLGKTPAKEIDFLNTLMDSYIQNDYRKKNQFGVRTIEFIDKQLAHVHDSLIVAEEQLQLFRSDKNIIEISSTSQALIQQLEELERDGAKLRVQREYLNNTLSQITSDTEAFDYVIPSYAGITDPYLNKLLIQLSDLNEEKIEKSFSSVAGNPVVKIVEQKIQLIKKELIENLASLLKSTNITISDNNRRTNELKLSLNDLPESERSLVNIERKFLFNDNIYNYLVQKRAEAGLALASNIPDKKVVDSARKVSDRPVSPNKKLIIFISVLIGIALPSLILIGSEFANNKVRDKVDLERLTDITIIGMVPYISKAKTTNLRKSKFALEEAFKFLALNLKQLYRQETNKIIGISSPQPGDGKTYCSYHLAAVYARSGVKTLYLDADVLKNKKQETKTNGKIQAPGLTEYLKDGIAWDSMITPGPEKNLFVVTGANTPETFSRITLSTENKLDELFKNIRAEFDLVIVDTPPLATFSDYFALTKYFDINLIVVRHDNTDKRALESCLNQMKIRSLNNVGFILNGIYAEGANVYGYAYS